MGPYWRSRHLATAPGCDGKGDYPRGRARYPLDAPLASRIFRSALVVIFCPTQRTSDKAAFRLPRLSSVLGPVGNDLVIHLQSLQASLEQLRFPEADEHGQGGLKLPFCRTPPLRGAHRA